MKDLKKLKTSVHFENIRIGDYVKFVGCTREQIHWGHNTDPEDLLMVNGVYYVQDMIIKSSHTKLILRGIKGKFNSVCFERLGDGSF
jgi:hypothetical protein